MDVKKLEKFIKERKYPKFRFGQITNAIFDRSVDTFFEIDQIPKDMREKLAKNISILPFEVVHIAYSKNGDAIKALLKLEDNHIIETVLIAPKPGKWSACISCQVGCAMACAFCATGKLGIKRDLTTDEITSQILFWRQYLKKENIDGEFNNIVYMGMGEPFMNWENVKESIDILIDEKLFNFPRRGLSVSTSGVAPGIEKFANECPQINLAISLHFASNEKRSRYMPVNKGYDLEKLKESLQYYLSKNNRKIFIEYIMLEGINDSREDAMLLTRFLKKIGKLQLLHVNLIRYNSIGEGFEPSGKKVVREFQNILQKQNIPCTIRKSVGDDIHGACGQLAGAKKPRS